MLEAVYRAHVQRIARWAARLGGPDFDVEDAVQETFLIVQRKLPSFRGEAAVETWLYKILENVVRHRKRKERWRRMWVDTFSLSRDHGASNASDDASEQHDSLVARIPSSGLSPSEQLEQREGARRLYRILETLPERHRTVLVLFELEGHTGEEIAALLGAKVATVWVWLHRARAAFAKRLHALGEAVEQQEQLRAPRATARPTGHEAIPTEAQAPRAARSRDAAKESVP